MRIGPLGIWELLIVGMVLLVAAALPVAVTVVVLRQEGQSVTNKLLFILLSWLVPLFGPLATLFLLRSGSSE